MKQIAHTINRDGKIVPANGFKKPEPTISMNNQSIWMHSIDRTDTGNPIQAFITALIGLVLFIVVALVIVAIKS